jgi:AcrR family transcriptional regulator
VESVVRDADATRARLLAAAHREFAAFGIAGARVDRIAAEAASNKAQIYHYFGSKEQLFDAVAAVVDEIMRELPLDVDDLPAYAVRLAERYEQHPDVLRLVTWRRLERSTEPPTVAVEASKATIAEIAQAQADGRLSDRYPADVLLHAVLHIAALWAPTSPEMAWTHNLPSAAARRRIVAQMVHDLLVARLPPGPTSGSVS